MKSMKEEDLEDIDSIVRKYYIDNNITTESEVGYERTNIVLLEIIARLLVDIKYKLGS